jgi:hypothetical protein
VTYSERKKKKNILHKDWDMWEEKVPKSAGDEFKSCG